MQVAHRGPWRIDGEHAAVALGIQYGARLTDQGQWHLDHEVAQMNPFGYSHRITRCGGFQYLLQRHLIGYGTPFSG